jgi:hypothetical protein
VMPLLLLFSNKICSCFDALILRAGAVFTKPNFLINLRIGPKTGAFVPGKSFLQSSVLKSKKPNGHIRKLGRKRRALFPTFFLRNLSMSSIS